MALESDVLPTRPPGTMSCYQFFITIHILYHFLPSGAVFDHSSLQAHTAFRYEIEKHNNMSASLFKLDKYEKIIPIASNYAFHRAGKSYAL